MFIEELFDSCEAPLASLAPVDYTLSHFKDSRVISALIEQLTRSLNLDRSPSPFIQDLGLGVTRPRLTNASTLTAILPLVAYTRPGAYPRYSLNSKLSIPRSLPPILLDPVAKRRRLCASSDTFIPFHSTNVSSPTVVDDWTVISEREDWVIVAS